MTERHETSARDWAGFVQILRLTQGTAILPSHVDVTDVREMVNRTAHMLGGRAWWRPMCGETWLTVRPDDDADGPDGEHWEPADPLATWVPQLRAARAAGDDAEVERLLRMAAADDYLSRAVMDLGLQNAWASGDVESVSAWLAYQAEFGESA